MRRFVEVSTTLGFEAETRYSRMTVSPSLRVKFTYSFRFVLKLGWNASPSSPCSEPLLTLPEMFRNGVESTLPLFWILIRPVCSTMNSRPLPSGAVVARTGFLSPLATRDSLIAPAGAAATEALVRSVVPAETAAVDTAGGSAQTMSAAAIATAAAGRRRCGRLMAGHGRGSGDWLST